MEPSLSAEAVHLLNHFFNPYLTCPPKTLYI